MNKSDKNITWAILWIIAGNTANNNGTCYLMAALCGILAFVQTFKGE